MENETLHKCIAFTDTLSVKLGAIEYILIELNRDLKDLNKSFEALDEKEETKIHDEDWE